MNKIKFWDLNRNILIHCCFVYVNKNETWKCSTFLMLCDKLHFAQHVSNAIRLAQRHLM